MSSFHIKNVYHLKKETPVFQCHYNIADGSKFASVVIRSCYCDHDDKWSQVYDSINHFANVESLKKVAMTLNSSIC